MTKRAPQHTGAQDEIQQDKLPLNGTRTILKHSYEIDLEFNHKNGMVSGCQRAEVLSLVRFKCKIIFLLKKHLREIMEPFV